MDFLDSCFTDAITPSDKQTKKVAIRAALEVAKKTLNRYYSLTDDSDVYRIAMGASLESSDS